jgi:hypothetical protein
MWRPIVLNLPFRLVFHGKAVKLKMRRVKRGKEKFDVKPYYLVFLLPFHSGAKVRKLFLFVTNDPGK